MKERIRTILSNKLIKNSFINLFFRVLGMVSNFLFIFVITNYYGAYSFGLLSLSISLIQIISIFNRFGLDPLVIKIISELRVLQNYSAIFLFSKNIVKITLVLGILIGLILVVFAPYISTNILNNEAFIPYMYLIGIVIIPFSLTQLIASFFQGLGNNMLFVLFQFTLIPLIFLAVSFLSSIFAIPFGYVHFSYYLVIFAIFILGVIIYINQLKSIRNKVSLTEYSDERKYTYKKLLVLGVPIFMGSSFQFIINWMDVVILSRYVQPDETGVYSSALRLSSLIGLGLLAVNTVIAPKLAEAFTVKDMNKLKGFMKKSSLLILSLGLPIFLGFTLFPTFFLSFFGKEFVQGRMILIILSFSQLTSIIAGSVGYLVLMTNNQRIFGIAMFCAFVLNLTINLILIPKIGSMGAAIANLTCNLISNLILIFFSKYKFKFWVFYTFR